jgi:hypothetical protein
MSDWEKAQTWENSWHGDCVNSYQEEMKQIVYSTKIGLTAFSDFGKYPTYDINNKNIVDIGGGPYSILLKCKNLGKCFVVDPNHYPLWVNERYKIKGITVLEKMGEKIKPKDFPEIDEVWIYNCLQHVENPEKIIQNAKKIGKIVRIFEWLEIGLDNGHLHVLHEDEMNKWLGGNGKIELLNESGCHGLSYYGIFKGEKYL